MFLNTSYYFVKFLLRYTLETPPHHIEILAGLLVQVLRFTDGIQNKRTNRGTPCRLSVYCVVLSSKTLTVRLSKLGS